MRLMDHLTTQETAEALGLTSGRIRQLRRAGVLVPDVETRLGNLYAPETIERLRAEREAASA